MLKILIADDEFFIKERLKVMVDYQSIGFEVVAEASNGKEAYELIEALKPDIAILDIKMPFLTGLEVAQKVQDNLLKTKCIILTSYEVFEFAQQSIRLGVVDYLLKPVSREELISILENTKKLIESEANSSLKIAAYNNSKFEEEFLDYLSGSTISAQKQQTESMLDKRIIKDNNFFVLFKIQNDLSFNTLSQEVRSFLLSDQYYSNFMTFTYTDNIAGIIINDKPSSAAFNSIKDLQKRLTVQLNYDVNIGISDNFNCLSDLIKEFNKALYALDFSMFAGIHSIVTTKNIKREDNQTKIPISGLRENLLFCFRSQNLTAALKTIKEKFHELKQLYPTMENLKILISEMLLTGYIYSNELSSPSNYSSTFLANELADAYNSIDGIYKWFKSYFTSLYNSINEGNHSQVVYVARKVQNIIEKNYSNPDLGLDFIASKVFYSQNYICTVFKKVTGFSIVQYITKCRMEVAKQMLMEDNIKLSDICNKVGYSDAFYFSKRFKKFLGQSPSEYTISNKK